MKITFIAPLFHLKPTISIEDGLLDKKLFGYFAEKNSFPRGYLDNMMQYNP